jgi:hypothetical protein
VNNSFWLVLGMVIGVTVGVVFYESEYRKVKRESDEWERLCKEQASAYAKETKLREQ